MVSGPTQNTSEAVTKPSMKRSRAACSAASVTSSGVATWPPLSRNRNQPPKSSSRSSMFTSDPMMPPISSDPSTISTGALPPTASENADEVTSIADSAPISNVTRPRASVTVSRVRCGSRWPSSKPMAEPTMTVMTLTRVPKPGNTS